MPHFLEWSRTVSYRKRSVSVSIKHFLSRLSIVTKVILWAILILIEEEWTWMFHFILNADAFCNNLEFYNKKVRNTKFCSGATTSRDTSKVLLI